eukprot:gene7170-7932_t
MEDVFHRNSARRVAEYFVMVGFNFPGLLELCDINNEQQLQQQGGGEQQQQEEVEEEAERAVSPLLPDYPSSPAPLRRQTATSSATVNSTPTPSKTHEFEFHGGYVDLLTTSFEATVIMRYPDSRCQQQTNNNNNAQRQSSGLNDSIYSINSVDLLDNNNAQASSSSSGGRGSGRKGNSFPEGIEFFCFPKGLTFLQRPCPPAFHSFVHTSEYGSRLIGCCLTICEELTEEEYEMVNTVYAHMQALPDHRRRSGTGGGVGGEGQSSRVRSSSGYTNAGGGRGGIGTGSSGGRGYFNTKTRKLYLQKALCVLSNWPFVDAFRRYLIALYQMVGGSGNSSRGSGGSGSSQQQVVNAIPMERYICNFIDDVPAPPAGKIDIIYYMNEEAITFQCPPLNLPSNWLSFPLTPLFQCLSMHNLLSVFTALLIERQIVLISSQFSLLTYCAEGLVSLLYPMTWLHPYIPILPSRLLGVLGAPFPFLVGLHDTIYEGNKSSLGSEVVKVFLDQDIVEVGTLGPLPALPDHRKGKLMIALESAVPWYASSLVSSIEGRKRIFLALREKIKNFDLQLATTLPNGGSGGGGSMGRGSVATSVSAGSVGVGVGRVNMDDSGSATGEDGSDNTVRVGRRSHSTPTISNTTSGAATGVTGAGAGGSGNSRKSLAGSSAASVGSSSGGGGPVYSITAGGQAVVASIYGPINRVHNTYSFFSSSSHANNSGKTSSYGGSGSNGTSTDPTTPSTSATTSSGKWDVNRMTVKEEAIREGFLKFFVNMLKYYKRYLIYKAEEEDPLKKFRFQDFLTAHSSDWHPLLKALSDTMCFSKFIDERVVLAKLDRDVVFFDEAIDAKLNRYTFRWRDLDTPFLLSNTTGHVKTYVTPSPCTTDLVGKREGSPYYHSDCQGFLYPRFPTLS